LAWRRGTCRGWSRCGGPGAGGRWGRRSEGCEPGVPNPARPPARAAPSPAAPRPAGAGPNLVKPVSTSNRPAAWRPPFPKEQNRIVTLCHSRKAIDLALSGWATSGVPQKRRRAARRAPPRPQAFPELLGCGPDRLRGNVEHLRSAWKLDGPVLAAAVVRQPTLLGYTIDCMGDCAGARGAAAAVRAFPVSPFSLARAAASMHVGSDARTAAAAQLPSTNPPVLWSRP
jgi:hypothetical protein